MRLQAPESAQHGAVARGGAHGGELTAEILLVHLAQVRLPKQSAHTRGVLSIIPISGPTRRTPMPYSAFCMKQKTRN